MNGYLFWFFKSIYSIPNYINKVVRLSCLRLKHTRIVRKYQGHNEDI